MGVIVDWLMGEEVPEEKKLHHGRNNKRIDNLLSREAAGMPLTEEEKAALREHYKRLEEEKSESQA